MRSKSLSLIALVVASLVTVPGLVQAQQPIRIGASMSETGAYATQGVPARAGYLLCQKHVNEKGGILGRKIEFLIYDDGSNTQNAARLMRS
jgi:branched-chain amino acid transport system substrate-binding protein